MLRPSYAELMDVLNKDNDGDNVKSRYTVVIAAAKRARQLIDGHAPLIDESSMTVDKAMSIAVQEIAQGKIEVVPEGQGTVLVLKKPELPEETEDEAVNIDGEDNEADDDMDGFEDEFDDEFDEDTEADADMFESLVSGLLNEEEESEE